MKAPDSSSGGDTGDSGLTANIRAPAYSSDCLVQIARLEGNLCSVPPMWVWVALEAR